MSEGLKILTFLSISVCYHLPLFLLSFCCTNHLKVLVGRVCFAFFVCAETMAMEPWWGWAGQVLKVLLAPKTCRNPGSSWFPLLFPAHSGHHAGDNGEIELSCHLEIVPGSGRIFSEAKQEKDALRKHPPSQLRA